MADVCLALMLAGLTAYGLLGSADFGAGFWDLTAGGDRRGGKLRAMIQRSMSPVWEANHVWLIFVIVIFWTAFPRAFGSIMSTLYVPLFGAVIGIIFRGAAFALRGQAGTMREARTLGGVFALSSVITPFCFGAAIGGLASGRVPVGNAAGDPFDSWLNPTSIFIGVLAVATGAHLAAVFLASDSRRVGEEDMVRAFRVRALASGGVAGVLALAGLVVVHEDAPRLFDGLTSGAGLAMVLVSGLAGVGTLAAVWGERFKLARACATVAVASVILGWAFAQKPYLLPGQLTLQQAAAPDSTLTALLVSLAVGMVFLVPSLLWLYRLALAGRLDQQYEPLDQRFKP